MLQLEERHLKIIHQILSKYSYSFYAYGSRVKGTARKYSDLDLCYREEVPSVMVRKIKEEFAESNLPFEVELVNWYHMNPEFQELIKKDLLKIA
jgi:uncharacterized protein